MTRATARQRPWVSCFHVDIQNILEALESVLRFNSHFSYLQDLHLITEINIFVDCTQRFSD